MRRSHFAPSSICVAVLLATALYTAPVDAQNIALDAPGCFTPGNNVVVADDIDLAQNLVFTFQYKAPEEQLSDAANLFTLFNSDGITYIAVHIRDADGGMTFGYSFNNGCNYQERRIVNVTIDVAIYLGPELFAVSIDGEEVCTRARSNSPTLTPAQAMNTQLQIAGTAGPARGEVCDMRITNLPSDVYNYQGEVRIAANGTLPQATFTSNWNGIVDGVLLVHKDGCVTCNNTAAPCSSNWGCAIDEDSIEDISVVVTEGGSDVTTFPIGVQVDETAPYYQIAGYDSESTLLELSTSGPPITVTAGTEYTVQYSEAYLNGLSGFGDLSDNSGSTVADVYLVLRCPIESDDGLSITQYHELVEENTHLVVEEDETFFQVQVRVPFQYTYARIEFEGATEPDASFETNTTAPSFWETEVQDCDTVHTGRIPWDEFRRSWGGVIEREGLLEGTDSATVIFSTTILITSERLVALDSDGLVTQSNTLRVPFEVTFELTHSVSGEVTITLFGDPNGTAPELDIQGAIRDLSVIDVNPASFDTGGMPAEFATGQLIFLTTLPAPYMLAPVSVTTTGFDVNGIATSLVINDNGTVENRDGELSGLFLHDNSQCSDMGIGDTCRQDWRVDITARQCTLNGIFDAVMQIVCAEEGTCALPDSPEDLILIQMVTTSDNFCGHTQEIEVHGEIAINSDPTQCNGRFNATVMCFPGEDSRGLRFELDRVDVLQVRAGPPVSGPPANAEFSGTSALLVYDLGSLAPYGFEFSSRDDNSVTFDFVWDADYLSCGTNQALVEVVVQVQYVANRNPTLLQRRLLSLAFDKSGTLQNRQELFQVTEERDRSLYIAGATSILALDESTTASAPASSGGLPAWVIIVIAVLVTGLCCLVFIVCGVWLFFHQRNKNRKYRAHGSGHETETEPPAPASEMSSAEGSGSTEVTRR